MPRRELARPAAFWTVAVLLTLMLAASGVPSPLYRVYAEQFGFGSGMLTVVFGVYAFALLLSLLVVGGLSDHVGRRPVLAGECPRPEPRFGARRDFQVHRQDGERWRLLVAFAPV